MFVICINDEGAKQFISKGKTYKVLHQEANHFMIVCNNGYEQRLYKSRFEILTCNNCIDRKCNSCDINK